MGRLLDGGGFTGINANLDMFLDKGYIAVVMTNCDGAWSPVDARGAEVMGKLGLSPARRLETG